MHTRVGVLFYCFNRGTRPSAPYAPDIPGTRVGVAHSRRLVSPVNPVAVETTHHTSAWNWSRACRYNAIDPNGRDRIWVRTCVFVGGCAYVVSVILLFACSCEVRNKYYVRFLCVFHIGRLVP